MDAGAPNADETTGDEEVGEIGKSEKSIQVYHRWALGPTPGGALFRGSGRLPIALARL